MSKDDKLWAYFRDVNVAVQAANMGDSKQPFKRGTFIVSALANDVELCVKDVSEEDAILIASELNDMGVKATLQNSVICTSCQARVPEQEYCTNCRNKLS